jgi:hypothetical protein
MSKYTFQIRTNPALDPIKERIKTQGRWNATALFPAEAKRTKKQPTKRLFIIARDTRRFVVVAENKAQAENSITGI